MLGLVITAALVSIALGQQQQTNNNTQCYFPGGKLHEKGIACANGAASSCCESSQTCLSNGLCWNPSSNKVTRMSCTDKSWNSELCPKFCTSEQRDSSAELRQCSGSSDRWVCGARSDDCSRNFTVPLGQVYDERPFSQNGILKAGTCVADSASGGSSPGPFGPGFTGRPPFIPVAGGASTVTVTATATASPDASAISAAAAAGICRSDAGDSDKKLATAIGLGVGLGLALPLAFALLGALFLWRRARRDAAAARAELAAVKDDSQPPAQPPVDQPGNHQHQLLHPSAFSSATSSPARQPLPPLYGPAAVEKPFVYEADTPRLIHQLAGTPEEMANQVYEAPNSPHILPSIPDSTASPRQQSPSTVHSRPFQPPATVHE